MSSGSLILSQFLESIPPNVTTSLADFNITKVRDNSFYFENPLINLHCSHCDGIRTFRPSEIRQYVTSSVYFKIFHEYFCRACEKSTKTFAVEYFRHESVAQFDATKFGESPPFGDPLPSRLMSIFGPDRDMFLKGRRCENQGLGIGAFSYYRRVVENQKNRLFDELIKAAERLKAQDGLIDELREAKKQTQFKEGISMVKHAIPDGLMVFGHNPLLLLHRAMSEGLHAQSDADCLDRAKVIRTVLSDLAARMASVFANEEELRDALNKLNRITGES